MTNSSLPLEYSITSTSPITIDASQLCTLNNITISSIGSGYTTGPNAFSNVSSISSIDPGEFIIKYPEDWVDQFPDWDRIQTMCNEYPGLKLAFEKFKTTYYLVKDHYDTPEDQRPRT